MALSIPQIAISCAVSDRGPAHDIAQALRASGYSVAPIEMGPAQVAETYGVQPTVIVVWSAASASSKWVAQEAAQALARGALVEIALQPVRGEAPLGPSEPILFEGWDHTPLHPAMKELRKRLKPIVGAGRSKRLSVTQATPWALGVVVVAASFVAIGVSLATRAPASTTPLQDPIRPIVATPSIEAPKIARPKDLRTAAPLQTVAGSDGGLAPAPLEGPVTEERDQGYSREDIAAIKARRASARKKSEAAPAEAPIEGPPL